MHILSIVGARPQFVKLAPICWNIKNRFNHTILHTGQHYDPLLSHSFFETLQIPNPDYQLNIGSGTHGEQTGRMMIEIEKTLIESKPDHVLLYGDTNTTLAGTLVAQKLHIPVSHVEAGLRSFNRRMPEETNRIVADHCSDLLFAPTKTALENLRNEGLGLKSYFVGDVMVETLSYIKNKVSADKPKLDVLFATLHRPENTDDPRRIKFIIENLKHSPVTILMHCHPRLKKVLEENSLYKDEKNLRFLPPLDYFSTIEMVSNSLGVVTDSGGLQKEAFILNKPCLVVRRESEWVETLALGNNFLDPNLDRIAQKWWAINSSKSNSEGIFGNGTAAEQILTKILDYSN